MKKEFKIEYTLIDCQKPRQKLHAPRTRKQKAKLIALAMLAGVVK